MDAMAFGMGSCCLQTTYQASDINEARYLYDHLSCVSPIFLALTACTPFLRGKVSDLDCRWTVISQSVDDRTDYEMNKSDEKTGNETQRIHKSRYSSIDSYLSNKSDFKVIYCLYFSNTFTYWLDSDPICVILRRNVCIEIARGALAVVWHMFVLCL